MYCQKRNLAVVTNHHSRLTLSQVGVIRLLHDSTDPRLGVNRAEARAITRSQGEGYARIRATVSCLLCTTA